MTVKISFTVLTYSAYRPDDKDPDFARKVKVVKNIYDGRVTKARIAKEIPQGATVESVARIDKCFDVDGEKTIAWLLENGTEKK